MATNKITEGRRVTYTNASGATIPSGAPVVVGSLVGVACADIADGASGQVSIERAVYQLPKTAGSAFTLGQALLFDVSAAAFIPGSATAAAGDISGCCVAAAAAASADTTALVLINAGVGTVETGT